MLVSYDAMTDQAAVHVFPGSRKFYQEEVPEITEKVRQFCDGFDGADLSFKIRYDRFLIFFVSEETPLDLAQSEELASFVQTLEREYELVLIDRINICFKQGEYVQRKEFPEFKKMIRNRSVSKSTIVFDPMVRNKREYEDFFESPAEISWIAHLF